MTQRLYLANFGDGVYQSINGGVSWSSIGGPLHGLRGSGIFNYHYSFLLLFFKQNDNVLFCSVSPDGKYVYITGGALDKSLGALNGATGVSRYDVSSKKWEGNFNLLLVSFFIVIYSFFIYRYHSCS